MKIKWLNHPTKPELNGSVEHVSRTLAEIAIGYQQAVFVPFKNYVERLNETAREGRDSSNTVVTFFKDPEWSAVATSATGRPTIFRKWGYETARFVGDNAAEQAKANGCPPSILKQFSDLLNAKNNPVAVDGDPIREQIERDFAARAATRAIVCAS